MNKLYFCGTKEDDNVYTRTLVHGSNKLALRVAIIEINKEWFKNKIKENGFTTYEEIYKTQNIIWNNKLIKLNVVNV